MKKIIFTITLLLIIFKSFSQNPILQGFADPALKVHNGVMYMLVGKDKSPTEKDFTMPYWALYSSTDLRHWKQECIINPKDTYLGAGYQYCWAGDIAFKNGKVYVYFSEHGEASGVVVADKPSGPFIDVLKKSLVPKETSINYEYDPTVFTDDDRTSYLIFGRDGKLGNDLLHYQIAKLNEDMISFAEPSHDLITSMPNGFGTIQLKKKIEGIGFDSVFIAQDHQYLHKHRGIYYLSRDVRYETAPNIYGPYSNRRIVSNTSGHSSYSEYNGQTYHAWEFTCEPYGNRVYRQVMMTYLHYKDNGDMVDDPDFVQGGKYYTTGVGKYNANWETIEAEWYFKKSLAIEKRDGPKGGFEIQHLTNNSFLNFPNIEDLKANSIINFSLSSQTEGGKIEIRQDSPIGKLLGTCQIPKTGSFINYQITSCKLKNKEGNLNLFFVFKGNQNDLAHIDSFNLK